MNKVKVLHLYTALTSKAVYNFNSQQEPHPTFVWVITLRWLDQQAAHISA